MVLKGERRNVRRDGNGITQRFQGAVIYCPWLIHNKCVGAVDCERRRGAEWLGGQEGGGFREGMQTVGALSMPAGSLSAVTSPLALSPDRFIRTIPHPAACIQKIAVTIVKLLLPFLIHISCQTFIS